MALAMARVSGVNPTDEVSTLNVEIGGCGFVGAGDTDKGSEWTFDPSGSGSVFRHDVDDAPLDHENRVHGTLGGASHGRGRFQHAITETVLRFDAGASPLAAGAETGEYARSCARVHGEYHLWIDEASIIDHAFCNHTEHHDSSGQMFIRKLVGRNFRTLVADTTAADRGIECIEDVVDGADLALVLAGWG